MYQFQINVGGVQDSQQPLRDLGHKFVSCSFGMLPEIQLQAKEVRIRQWGTQWCGEQDPSSAQTVGTNHDAWLLLIDQPDDDQIFTSFLGK
jgi:hypothetical protein